MRYLLKKSDEASSAGMLFYVFGFGCFVGELGENFRPDLPDLVDIDGLGDEFFGAAAECFFDVVLLVVRADHHDDNLVGQGVFGFEHLFMVLNLFGFGIAVHFGHVYVCEYDFVVDFAARLCHVFVVHVHSYQSIDSFIAFFIVLKLYH